MNLQGRNLSTNLTGSDVALLHTELAQLGYVIPAPEVTGKLFGPGTLQSVRDFPAQARFRRHGYCRSAERQGDQCRGQRKTSRAIHRQRT